MVATLLQFAATVLLAATFAADVITFIYLISRDGFKRVVTTAPKYVMPKGQYEQGLYLIASFIILWELGGFIFAFGSPNNLLTVLIMFIVLSGVLVALKQYDDAREKELDQQQTLLVMAFPIAVAEDSELLVQRIRECVVATDEPIYVNKVTKTLLELRDSLGIDVLHEAAKQGEAKHANI